jgi:hydroxyacylglutathione hydrolase
LLFTSQIEPDDGAGSGRMIVDVRGESEWEMKRIPGATHAFLGDLLAKLGDVPKETPLVMQCGSGSRSAIGASLLQAAGFTDVANMKGGIDAWQAAGLEVEEGD